MAGHDADLDEIYGVAKACCLRVQDHKLSPRQQGARPPDGILSAAYAGGRSFWSCAARASHAPLIFAPLGHCDYRRATSDMSIAQQPPMVGAWGGVHLLDAQAAHLHDFLVAVSRSAVQQPCIKCGVGAITSGPPPGRLPLTLAQGAGPEFAAQGLRPSSLTPKRLCQMWGTLRGAPQRGPLRQTRRQRGGGKRRPLPYKQRGKWRQRGRRGAKRRRQEG